MACGRVRHRDFVRAVETHFHLPKGHRRETPKVPRKPKRRVRRRVQERLSQVHVAGGVRIPPYSDPKRYAFMIINAILGAGMNMITFEEDGTRHDRVVSRLESDGKLYVAANHWPRAWYNRALENPEVQATLDGETGDHLAVPVSGEEHDRVDSDNSLPVFFRILTGFPPRYFVRLDPREP